ncbi:hypothetical protein [Chromatium okenii]|jgi:hypothetical protein|uniref:hypothetical protein n=1 Tax=Chromatium okenii TaxID=61644 RepID=UPI0026F02C60|nr:hypothetical protein [Chromatium okenii]MBV5309090.1 hypothetical protein [Chromatium okenii]
MSATLALTLSFLTIDTNIDKRGKTTTHEVIAYTTTAIPYDTMQACNNAKEEYNLAVGAYQLFKRPTRIIGAICNDSKTGVVE